MFCDYWIARLRGRRRRESLATAPTLAPMPACGRSSKHRSNGGQQRLHVHCRVTGCPAFAGHDTVERVPLPCAPRSPTFGAPMPDAAQARPLKKGDHVFLVDGSSYIFRAYFAMFKAAQARGRSAPQRSRASSEACARDTVTRSPFGNHLLARSARRDGPDTGRQQEAPASPQAWPGLRDEGDTRHGPHRARGYRRG